MEKSCPCSPEKSYEECCQPYVEGQSLPPTAEALMRSRYTAYALGKVDYIRDTLAPESRSDFDMAATKKWANEAEWMALKVLSTKQGQSSDKRGVVEFMATYKENGQTLDHHEVSKFRKTEKGQWLFVSGDSHVHREGEDHHHHHKTPETIVRSEPKVGRNDPCPCGSGKKYKKCCGVAA